MAVGTLYAGVCYPTQLDAVRAACSYMHKVDISGASVGCHSFNAYTGPSLRPSSSEGGDFWASFRAQALTSAGAVTYPVSQHYLSACDPSAYSGSGPFNLSNSDGLAVSGAIAGVWLFAWCFRALVQVLHSDGVSTDR
jgi:hypothetical protein